MGLADPGLWVAASLLSTAVVAIARLLRVKIDADLQKELAEMALRDTRPEDRSTIIRNLSGLRHFSPQLSDEPVLDEKLSATRLPGLRRKR